MADLTGNLASFDLRQVLGFLAGTAATGELAVSADHAFGRILFQNGSLGYATTATGDDTVRELDALLERHQAGGFGASALNQDPVTLEEVLREQLTEVLHSLSDVESGSFAFTGSPDPQEVIDVFEVDELLGDVDTRTEEWRKIREVVPANDTVYQLVSAAPGHGAEVTLSAPLWALVAALGAGASVTDLADSLGVYEFHAALKVADLVEGGLLERAGVSVDAETSGETDWRQSADDSADEWLSVEESVDDWESVDEPTEEWQSDLEALAEPEVPRIEPTTEPVTFSKQDLSSEERDEMIRNIGRGIFPG